MTEFFAGRFELLQPIASGGMGTVWCVRDQQDGEIKAAKILGQSDATSLLRFVREQSMRIDHRHVVTPESWAGMDDRVLFTMPMVRGGSVADLLRDHGPLPVRWVAELLDQTLQALEAVHGAGIVHRDVKPANLLLEPTGTGQPHLRLTDFGIAAPVDQPRMTRASMAIGSPGYMAPEQWYGADPDPRADLYSAATVAVELLTGERPVASPEPAEPPVPTDSGPTGALLTVLTQALHKDVADRPASATEMRQSLAALQLTAIPPSPGEAVSVPDRFGDLVPANSAPQTRRFTAPATVLQPSTPRSAAGAPGWSAYLLIVLGLVSLVAALFLAL